jgi:hypothetical protein
MLFSGSMARLSVLSFQMTLIVDEIDIQVQIFSREFTGHFSPQTSGNTKKKHCFSDKNDDARNRFMFGIDVSDI